MTGFGILPDPAAPLSPDEARSAFAAILDGQAGDADIASFLLALSERGETAIEIAEAARGLRERMIAVEAPPGAIDVCGTGGDGHHTLNVSTAVALVIAACGVPVAKHGNRAASSKAGAADTLEALGLNLDRATGRSAQTLDELGIAFLFAANHHPALRRLAPLRRAIGRRTIFNLMGPLANPARVGRQLIGIARPDYVPVYAEALALLGSEAAAVVAGEDALDELSTAGPSVCANIGAANLPDRVTPEDAGLARHAIERLRGGDAAYNAAALRDLLGGATGAYRDAVLLNTAAALMVAGKVDDLKAGAVTAADAIDSGAAARLLTRWIERT